MTHPLLILAADQRPWLTQELFGHTGVVTPDERAFTTEAKHMVLDGLSAAVTQDPVERAGILVDAELGPGVAERARDRGLAVAIPLEFAGRPLYETDVADLAGYLAHYRPDYAKVLVRYRPDDPAEARATQRQRLAEAADIVHGAGLPFLFELLVDPNASEAGEQERFVTEIRPELTRAAMREIAQDVLVDIWKLEQQGTSADFEAAVTLADQHDARCILLGAGAPLETVLVWIRMAAQSGFRGFAVGRTIWADAVTRLYADRTTREAGVAYIKDRYLRCAQAFLDNQPSS